MCAVVADRFWFSYPSSQSSCFSCRHVATGPHPSHSPASFPVAEFERGKLYGTSGAGGSAGFPVIVLSGDWRQMGRQYGALLGGEMAEIYDTVIAGRSYADLVQFAEDMYAQQFAYRQAFLPMSTASEWYFSTCFASVPALAVFPNGAGCGDNNTRKKNSAGQRVFIPFKASAGRPGSAISRRGGKQTARSRLLRLPAGRMPRR